jgi:hypothetical protein
MARTQSRKSAATNAVDRDRISQSGFSRQQMPAVELLSFLKETGRFQTWTEKDVSKTLNIGLPEAKPEAKEAMAVLDLQGYIQHAADSGEWRVTAQGDVVSGAKPPRFTRQSVEDALAGLRNRIKAVNEDSDVPYRIIQAVAFGDFLGDAARVQAADVGIRLVPKTHEESIAPAKEHTAELNFLKQLRGKTALLHVGRYEDWMSSRSHMRLL